MKRVSLAAASLVVALAFSPAARAEEQEPGVFKIPGTETTIKLNGFVEVDSQYDFDGADDDIRGSDWASFLEFQPLDDLDTQKNMFYLTSRTSRLGLTTTTPTGWGNLVVKMEGDFNSPSPFNYSTEATTNGVTFRMRHAYGELGGRLLIGQTWGTMNDLASFPDTVDFNGHGAFGANRRPMVRYTLPVGAGSLALALENPQSVAQGSVTCGSCSLTVGRRYDRIPDLVANFTTPIGKAAHVSVRAVALEYNGETETGAEDSKWGWSAAASGSLKFAAETLVWGVQAGDGMGIHNFQTLFQGAAFVGDEIETWMGYSYHVGLTHAWSSSIRSNLIWSQTFVDEDDDLTAVGVFGAPSLVNKRVDAGYVNTFISPVKNTEFGLEYAYGQRVVAEGGVAPGAEDKGTQHRVNFLARYSFF